jgi:hypothetical protein
MAARISIKVDAADENADRQGRALQSQARPDLPNELKALKARRSRRFGCGIVPTTEQ